MTSPTFQASDSGFWVVAVDGGGSKIAIAASYVAKATIESGNPNELVSLPDSLNDCRVWQFLGTGSAHPSTWEAASQHLQQAIGSVIEELHSCEQPVRFVQLALAGAGRREDQQRVIDTLKSHLPVLMERHIEIECVGDIEPLVSIPTTNGQDPTIAVILGTGSIVATYNAQHHLVRAGGWGPLLGDQCSGGALGLAGLRCVASAIDAGLNYEHSGPLVQRIIDHLTLAQPSAELNTLLIQTAANRTQAAQLSLIVLEHALDRQDAVARQIVEQHVREIAWQIQQVALRAFGSAPSIRLVFSGGLADRSPALCNRLVSECHSLGLAVSDTLQANPLLATLHLAMRSC